MSFWNGLGEVLAFLRVPSLAEAVPFRENLYSAYPKRLEDEGLAFCVVCGKKAQLHRCGMCGGPLHLTCLPKAEGGVAHSDIVCGPCAALRSDKPATLAMGELSLSFEERLLDPEEEEGDDSWTRLKGSSRELALRRSMGYEKPFLLQGLFNRAGERPNWVKEMWAETGADAPSDGPLELPFKPGEGRGPEQLLRDQMDDHDTWEILNYLRKGEPGAEKVSARDEIRLRTAAAKHTLSPDGFLCRKVHLPLKTAEVPVLPSTGGWRQWAF